MTEYDEQVAFVEWLELKGLKFTAIPNSTYTTSWNQKRKNKAMGVRKGLPDLLVFIDNKQSITDNALLLFVEMKRPEGGVVSGEQKQWIVSLNKVDNVQAEVCKGCKKAIEFVYQYIK